MNIYDKINNMFKEEDDNTKLLYTILDELAEIKQILKMPSNEYKKEYQKTLPDEYYQFVENFKEKMKEDVINGKYSEIEFEGMRLGVNQRGLLYDKDTNQILPKYKAFDILEKLYNEKYQLVIDVEDII